MISIVTFISIGIGINISLSFARCMHMCLNFCHIGFSFIIIARKQVDYMKSWSLALTLMAVLLLAAVLLLVVRPPVYAVQKNKDGA